LAGFFGDGGGDAAQRRDRDAALSEFIPNFDPGEYDEDTLEVFRRIVDSINRLRAVPASSGTRVSRPFTLNLKRCDWDADTVSALSQIEHAIEQIQAAIEDGSPLPPVD
jgi:hypothetical protein